MQPQGPAAAFRQLICSAQYRVNYVQPHCSAHRETCLVLETAAALMLTAVLTVSHLFCFQRYFTFALLRSASDEKNTCESVTHSCTHDSSAKCGLFIFKKSAVKQATHPFLIGWPSCLCDTPVGVKKHDTLQQAKNHLQPEGTQIFHVNTLTNKPTIH